MVTDNENKNEIADTDPNNQASCDAQLVAGVLTKGFRCLEREIDGREKLLATKMEQREKETVH